MAINIDPLQPTPPTLWRNLLDLPRSMIGSVWLAGLLVVVISYSGPLVLAFEAAEKAKLTQQQLASWIWAITFVSGIATVGLSLWHRQPVITAWSTPGLALLATSLADYPLSEVVGAYLFVGFATLLLGFSGLFDKLLALIPPPIALAILGGILLRYGLGLFSAIPQQPYIVMTMIAVFLILRSWHFRTTMAFVLIAGVAVAFVFREVHLDNLQFEVVKPVWIWPTFRISALINLGVPLFALAMASQNAPGVAMMKAFHYRPPVNSALIVTGIATLLSAPTLNHGLNLAAITAAVCNSPEAHPDPNRRYAAGVATGTTQHLGQLCRRSDGRHRTARGSDVGLFGHRH